MKKMVKFNLDELAEQMQQINQDETESFVGGERYYSSTTGEFLGVSGTNQEVRITSLSKEEFNRLNFGPGASSQLMSQSNGWGSMGESNQQKILSELAGYPIGTFRGDANGSGGYYDGSGIALNVNWSLCATGNVADLMLMIVHEEAHKSGSGEYGAFQRMYHSSWYDSASRDMQRYIVNGTNTY